MSNSGSYSAPNVPETGIYHSQYTGGPAAAQPAGGGATRSGSESSGAGSGFQVSPSGMRAQASEIAQCADQAAGVLNRLRSALEAGGMPWGTDDMGKTFGQKYTGPANQGFASIAGLPAALANVANELAGQADTYDRLEQGAAEAINRIGRSAAGIPASISGSAAGSAAASAASEGDS